MRSESRLHELNALPILFSFVSPRPLIVYCVCLQIISWMNLLGIQIFLPLAVLGCVMRESLFPYPEYPHLDGNIGLAVNHQVT